MEKFRERIARLVPYARWAVVHRRKVASVVIVLVPLVARLVPGFPSADIISILRTYFGA